MLALGGLIMASPTPASAQGLGNPFAGGAGAGFGPYGNATGATAHLVQLGPMVKAGAATATVAESREPPHRAELREGIRILEAMFVGCAAGAFLGGYTSWATVVPTAELAIVAAPATGSFAVGLASASAIGCGLGAATAAVTLTAGAVWSLAFH